MALGVFWSFDRNGRHRGPNGVLFQEKEVAVKNPTFSLAKR